MTDLSAIRSRRRNRLAEHGDFVHPTGATNHQTIDFSGDSNEKNHGFVASGGFYNPINTVFAASTTQLWNSAQEAFSSIQPSQYIPTTASYGSFSNVVPCEELEDKVPDFICFGREEIVPLNMPSRDRTSEFKTTAKSYQMRMQGNGFQQPQHQNSTLNESIQFNQIAKRIGRDLSLTCAKMERLAEMAKKRSLFSDGGEVEVLSRDIKEAITGLNKQIASLQEYSRRRNGQTNNTKQGQGHSQLVVVGLQSKLANVSKDFQTVLEVRTENLKHQKNRREKFSVAEPVPSTLPSSSSSPNVRSRLLEDDIAAGGSVALDMDTLEQHRTQTQLYADQSSNYAQARTNMMETIEGSISELGQIFTQLASLVSEQGEMIERIDSNVEDTAINIDAAHSELVKYFHNISQNRWLMIKVFGVLMVFFVVFVLFLT